MTDADLAKRVDALVKEAWEHSTGRALQKFSADWFMCGQRLLAQRLAACERELAQARCQPMCACNCGKCLPSDEAERLRHQLGCVESQSRDQDVLNRNLLAEIERLRTENMKLMAENALSDVVRIKDLEIQLAGLRAGLRSIADGGTHGWDAVARRLLGDPS